MWPRTLSTVALSTALGTHFFIVEVSSLVSPHSTHPLSVAPSPMKQICRFRHEPVPKNRRMIRSPVTAVASYGPPLGDLQSVPKDDTFCPMGFLREVIAAPVPPADCNRFDGIGKETGGVWRSRVMGLLPSTVRKKYRHGGYVSLMIYVLLVVPGVSYTIFTLSWAFNWR